MGIDINYYLEQHDSFSGDFVHLKWWCEICHDYHYFQYGQYGQLIDDCLYENCKYCSHCGQLIKMEA